MKVDANGQIVASFGSPSTALFLVNAASPVVDELGNVYFISGDGVLKLDDGGTPVASFGNGGRAALPGLGVRWFSLARDGVGNLYAAGGTGVVGSGRVAKLDRDGFPVLAFGIAGVAAASQLNIDKIVADFSGAVFLSGYVTPEDTPLRAAVMKLRPDGGSASDFGVGGLWVGDCSLQESFMAAIALDGQGGLLIGTSCTSGSRVIKLSATTGAVVESFRQGGREGGLFGQRSGLVRAIAVGQPGSIYAAGTVEFQEGCSDMAIAKLDGEGRPVASFGAPPGGVTTVNEGERESFFAVALDRSGRVYATGLSRDPCLIVRPAPTVLHLYRLGP
jgi:hypothetical protein